MWIRVVQLMVTARIRAMAVGGSGADRDRRARADPGELRVAGEPVDPGDLADQLGGNQHAEATLGQRWGATSRTSCASTSCSALIVRVSSLTRRIMSLAIRTRTVGCVGADAA